MGPTVINGLPAHVLLVHAVVVFVPLAAILLICSALWPAARRRLGIITPITALIAVAIIPPTTHAGEWLIQRVDKNPELHTHAHLADTLLPWAIGMFVVAAALWVVFTKQHWLTRRSVRVNERVAVGAGAPAPAEPEAAPAAASVAPVWLRATRVVAVALALVVSVGSVVDTYLIGDSGAKSAWTGGFSMAPESGGHS